MDRYVVARGGTLGGHEMVGNDLVYHSGPDVWPKDVVEVYGSDAEAVQVCIRTPSGKVIEGEKVHPAMFQRCLDEKMLVAFGVEPSSQSGPRKDVTRIVAVESDTPDWEIPQLHRRKGQTPKELAKLTRSLLKTLNQPIEGTQEALAQWRAEKARALRTLWEAKSKQWDEAILNIFEGQVSWEAGQEVFANLCRDFKVQFEVQEDYDFDALVPEKAEGQPLMIHGKFVKILFLASGEEVPEGLMVLWDSDHVPDDDTATTDAWEVDL